jgi:Fur family ferric uptake transcriptional regulator
MSDAPHQSSPAHDSPVVEGGATRLRPTRQRAAVLRALAEGGDLRTVAEWHAAVSRPGEKVGLTTVYRTLAALAAAGEVDAIHGEDGEVRYRRCRSRTHHHHLVCRICGSTVEIDARDVETWAAAVAGDHGFVDVTHTVEVFGVCPDCSQG